MLEGSAAEPLVQLAVFITSNDSRKGTYILLLQIQSILPPLKINFIAIATLQSRSLLSDSLIKKIEAL